MNKPNIKYILPIAAIALLLLMVAWMAGFFTEKIIPGKNPTDKVDESNAITVALVNIQRFEPVPATIQAKQATIISSRILARIEKFHVRAGDHVERGQLLIELEKTDLQSRSAQANAQVRSVTARLTEAQHALNRAIDLSNKGVFAKADLDRAKANHDALLANLATAKQGLQQAQVALSFSQVRAPIAGRVVDRFAEPGDTAQPGVQLLSLYNPLSLRVEANVREKLALSLKLNQTLEVIIPSNDNTLVAEIEELVPAGNSGSRSFLVKSRLPYSQGLLPGMYARLMLPARVESLLLIPNDRVAKVGQLNVVWVVNNGITERRFIRTGKVSKEGMIEVVSGLSKGEKILPILSDG